MSLTTVQKKQIIAVLSSHLFEPVDLLCDGRKITLSVEMVKPLRFKVLVYVDDEFKGRWIFGKDYESKFLRQTQKFYLSKKSRDIFKKLDRTKADNAKTNEKRAVWHWDFPSGKAALTHLLKVCDDVSLYVKPEKS